MVLGHGLALTAGGVAIGLFVAVSLNLVLASLLFGIRPFDPPTIGVVIGVIGTVALVACYLRARSATR